MTHDNKRNGKTCLFAALNVLEGNVIGSCYPRHRNIEFLKFLRNIDREAHKDLAIHIILDNYGTHNHPNVKAWRAGRLLSPDPNVATVPTRTHQSGGPFRSRLFDVAIALSIPPMVTFSLTG